MIRVDKGTRCLIKAHKGTRSLIKVHIGTRLFHPVPMKSESPCYCRKLMDIVHVVSDSTCSIFC